MDKVKVLVVEDNPELVQTICEKLSEDRQLEVIGSAGDGMTALELCRQKKPDVMLLDIVMPELDGFGVLEKLRGAEHRPKVVVLSALSREEFINRALQSGAAYYMIKPCDFATLKQRILETMRPAAAADYNKGAGTDRAAQPVKFARTKSVEEKITNIFITVGIPAHIKGYQFLREAIKLAIENPEIINCITKKLYPTIAGRFETTPSKVERAIRHAIEVAWNRGKIENINSLFGIRVYTNNEKPTNGEFIALVADKMLIEGA